MKKRKKLFIGLGVLILLIIVAVLSLNWYIKSEIKEGLDEEMTASEFQYEEISVNVLTSKASVSRISYKIDGLYVEADDVQLKNFSYSDYFLDGNIVVGDLVITNPKLILYPKDTTQVDTIEEPIEKIKQPVRIRNLTINGGEFKMQENDTAINSLFLNLDRLYLQEVVYSEEYRKEKLPFGYQQASLKGDSLYYDMNEEHYISLKDLHLENEELSFVQFKITPKHSRAEFSRRIPYAKDQVVMELEGFRMQEFKWEFQNDTLLIKSALTKLEGMDLNLYRNKLLPEDPNFKPLYSEMLRELGMKLKLDSLQVDNSQIVYEEQVREDRGPGKVSFQNVEASIKDLTNYNMDKEDFSRTRVIAKALFMGQAQLELNWEFDVSNTRDEFTATGHLAGISANAMNSFIKPAMNVEVEGEIKSIFYNFYGNNYQANGDMQLSYKDFKLNILDKDGNEKRSFFSDLANIFIKNDAVNEDVAREEIQVERLQNKSFWNFLWLCIRDGAFGAFI